jgi:flagellar motor switch/type III secretory pathway protein FliN
MTGRQGERGGGPTTTAASVAPFPFASLEHLTRGELAIASRLRGVAARYVAGERLATAMTELVGEPVSLRLRGHHRLLGPRGTDDAVGVTLALPSEGDLGRRVLVEVEGALGAALVARALRQRAPRVVDASRPPSPALAGAFAAVLLAALRRAHADAVPRVLAAGPGSDLARDLLVAARDVTTARVTVVVGDDAFEARVSVPDALLPSTPRARFSSLDLAGLGELRLSLPLVVATGVASRRDLAALEEGDAFLPGRFPLVEREGALTGPVALVAPASELGLSATLAEGRRLVVRALLESHPWVEERAMPSEPSVTSTAEALEDAPLVVRVELGSVEMKAGEWAALVPGDVVALGRRLGEPALLRVGGVEVARGELVQVDGEYGVRIVSRGPSRG